MIEAVSDWYYTYFNQVDLEELTLNQIEIYESRASKEFTMGKLEKDKIRYTPLKKISNPLGDICCML